ncbi:MAG: hypothetical protein HYU55_01700 [Nocardioides sp.]|nr:hypothetical protein [Nocardioides sp.]
MADGEPEQDADQRTDRDQPSLELPRLGWRRRRRTQEGPEPQPEPHAGQKAEPHAGQQAGQAREETRPLVEETAPLTVAAPVRAAEPAAETEPDREPKARRPGGLPVVVLTGVVVGLGIVGLTWASLRLCESVQGTSSCGDAGYGLLIVILVVMVILGALLLRLARVPEPGSTSFLAVGLTSVLALVFLVDSLMDRPMVVVIPLISAATFALAHWVTRTFAGPAAG